MPNPKTWKALAAEIGCTPETLSKWRREHRETVPAKKSVAEWKTWMAEHKSEGKGSGRITLDGKTYTKQDLIDLKGRLTNEQARKEAANASLRELELKMKAESLVPESEAKEVIIKTLQPVRRLMDAMPRQCAANANPAEPGVAELAMRNYLDERVFAEIVKILEKEKNAK